MHFIFYEEKKHCSVIFFYLLALLLNIFYLRKLSQIDIDEETLRRFQDRAAPIAWDYLTRRKIPLTVDVYHGSIDSPHECLESTDVVVCVEV